MESAILIGYSFDIIPEPDSDDEDGDAGEANAFREAEFAIMSVGATSPTSNLLSATRIVKYCDLIVFDDQSPALVDEEPVRFFTTYLAQW